MEAEYLSLPVETLETLFVQKALGPVRCILAGYRRRPDDRSRNAVWMRVLNLLLLLLLQLLLMLLLELRWQRRWREVAAAEIVVRDGELSICSVVVGRRLDVRLTQVLVVAVLVVQLVLLHLPLGALQPPLLHLQPAEDGDDDEEHEDAQAAADDQPQPPAEQRLEEALVGEPVLVADRDGRRGQRSRLRALRHRRLVVRVHQTVPELDQDLLAPIEQLHLLADAIHTAIALVAENLIRLNYRRRFRNVVRVALKRRSRLDWVRRVARHRRHQTMAQPNHAYPILCARGEHIQLHRSLEIIYMQRNHLDLRNGK